MINFRKKLSVVSMVSKEHGDITINWPVNYYVSMSREGVVDFVGSPGGRFPCW